MDRRTGAPQAVLARGSIIGSVMFAVSLALGDVAAAAEGDVTTPAVEVVGHYETAVGTSDAASEGSVTYKLIEDRPLLRTGEILEFVPGMIVTQHSGDGKANQYFLRGYNLDHGTDFATFVNGMPVNMPTHGHGQGYSDLNFVIPELVEHIDFKKGPYYADEGDFASTGAAHLEYFTKLPSNIAQVTVGSNNYRRALIAASPEIADGNLLLAFEAASYDGPWVNPEDAERYNATLRYSKGDALSGLSLTAMAYDNKWNSTDQIAQRAVDQGLITPFGALDPTDGGQSTRYSLSFEGHTPLDALGKPQMSLDAYVIGYNLDLWSNFTYFLDNPTDGDQFHQADRRVVYGLRPSLAWSGKLGAAETTTRVGLQARYDDISRVELSSTVARQLDTVTRQDKVGEGQYGLFVDNSTQWTKWFRSIVGIRFDYYTFDDQSNLPQNSGRIDDHITSPKLSLIFGPWYKTEYFVNAGYGFHSNDARGALTTVDPTDPTTAVTPVTPLVRTKGAEFGIRTEIIPKLQSSLAFWILTQDSELLFTGDAGTTEPSRASRREGIEWINLYRPLSWLTFDAQLSLSKARFTSIDPANPDAGPYIPGAIPVVAQLGATVQDLGRWSGSVNLRYFGPHPLIEDNSVRSNPSTIVNMRVGYKLDKTWSAHFDILNVLNSDSHDIDYYYASCLRSEVGTVPACTGPRPVDGVNDIHFHPAEPREFRFTVTARF
jgi:hypothetical protein